MKKNIVFIPNIKLDGDGRWAESRSTPYEYSIKSWRHWCDKNNVELFLLGNSPDNTWSDINGFVTRYQIDWNDQKLGDQLIVLDY